jgi:glycosyltransferase involved in cell wall biosynthesis
MQASDVLLVNQRPSVADMSLPSKLTSYFAAGRPVVAAASAESETAREIAAAGAGFVVPPDDPRALRDTLLALRDDESRAAALGKTAERYAATHLSSAVVLEEYERYVEELVERR